jgi:hypothetical protein
MLLASAITPLGVTSHAPYQKLTAELLAAQEKQQAAQHRWVTQEYRTAMNPIVTGMPHATPTSTAETARLTEQKSVILPC